MPRPINLFRHLRIRKPGFLRKQPRSHSLLNAVAAAFVILTVVGGLSLTQLSNQSSEQLAKDKNTQSHLSASSSATQVSSLPGAGETNDVSAPQGTTTTHSAPSGHTNPSQSSSDTHYLVVSPNTITLTGPYQQCAGFTISASDNWTLAYAPTFSNSSIVWGSAGDYQHSNSGHSWQGTVCKIGVGYGQDTLTVTAIDRPGHTITGTLAVNVPFTPYFTVTQGTVTQTSSTIGADEYVTFTMPFTIHPSADFGNPTLRFSTTEPYLAGCTGGIFNIVTVYNGQNDFAFVCTATKLQAEQWTDGGWFGTKGVADGVEGGFNFTFLIQYRP